MTTGLSAAHEIFARRRAGFAGLRRASAWTARGVALLVLLVLQANWFSLDVPLALKLFQAALVALACVRLDAALLVLAGLGPLATSLIELTGATFPGDALFEQMVLAALTGAVVHWPRAGRLRLAWPAALCGAMIVASVAATLPARLLAGDPGPSAWAHLLGLWQGEYAIRLAIWRPLYLSTITLEGLGLACAIEASARRDPGLLRRLLGVSLLAFASVNVLNAYRLVAASLRGGLFPASLVKLFLKVRLSTQYDKNAAGSVFALIGLACVPLVRRPAWRAAVVAAGLALIVLGLWMTGSRTAQVACAVVAGAALAVAALRRPGITRWLALATIVAMVAGGGLLVARYPRGRNHFSVSQALESRRILADVALRAAASAPVFGIGFGTFFERSVDFGSRQLLTIGWARPHENAHDYFLQVLAECGIVGLAAFLLVPAAVLGPALRAGWRRPEILRVGLAGGIVAFMLTWLTGHPMLVPDAAFAFWMFVGLLAATMTPPSAWRPAVTWAAGLAIVALLVSVPVRAARGRDALDLEHRGVGVSLWQDGPDGVRARSAGAQFALFLPVDARIALPVRLASQVAATTNLEVRLDGRLMNAVPISGAEWRTVVLQFPSRGRRYERIDFSVTTTGGAPLPSIWVGKDDDMPIR